MEIRYKNLNDAQMSSTERENYKILEEIIFDIEKVEKFTDKIGAEIMISNARSALHIYAFNPIILSEFIGHMMVAVANTKSSCTFSSVNVENDYSPTHTNIIVL